MREERGAEAGRSVGSTRAGTVERKPASSVSSRSSPRPNPHHAITMRLVHRYPSCSCQSLHTELAPRRPPRSSAPLTELHITGPHALPHSRDSSLSPGNSWSASGKYSLSSTSLKMSFTFSVFLHKGADALRESASSCRTVQSLGPNPSPRHPASVPRRGPGPHRTRVFPTPPRNSTSSSALSRG